MGQLVKIYLYPNSSSSRTTVVWHVNRLQKSSIHCPATISYKLQDPNLLRTVVNFCNRISIYRVIELRTQRRSIEEGPWVVVEAISILRRHLGLWGTHVAVILICRMWLPVKGCSQGPRCRCSWYGAAAGAAPRVSPPPPPGTPPDQRWQTLAAAADPRHSSGSALAGSHCCHCPRP